MKQDDITCFEKSMMVSTKTLNFENLSLKSKI